MRRQLYSRCGCQYPEEGTYLRDAMRGSVCGILLLLVFPLACSVSRSIQPPPHQSQAPVELHATRQRETASRTASELARLQMDARVNEYKRFLRDFDTTTPPPVSPRPTHAAMGQGSDVQKILLPRTPGYAGQKAGDTGRSRWGPLHRQDQGWEGRRHEADGC